MPPKASRRFSASASRCGKGDDASRPRPRSVRQPHRARRDMTLAWTAHPARRRPQDAMLAACVIALASYAVLVGLESAWLALVAAVMLLLPVAPFLARTHYLLHSDRIPQRRPFVTRPR